MGVGGWVGAVLVGVGRRLSQWWVGMVGRVGWHCCDRAGWDDGNGRVLCTAKVRGSTATVCGKAQPPLHGTSRISPPNLLLPGRRADFTNALVDKTQQMALCRYADGTNPVTGIDTRKSLGCGSRRAFRASVPSNPDGPQPSEEEKVGCHGGSRLCRMPPLPRVAGGG